MKLEKIKRSSNDRKSRFMSLILRHKPSAANLILDKNGYVEVSKLLTSLNMTIEDLDWIVETNDKKRFEYNNDKTKIRANRGHNKKLDLDIQLEIVDPPEILYHGTAKKFMNSIENDGLKSMERKHVHLSSNIQDCIKVAKRHDKTNWIILSVDSKQMANEGYKFQLSSDGMYLTEHVPPKYLSKI